MNIELTKSELNTIRHALVRLDRHNRNLCRPYLSKYYKGICTPEQCDRAELELDIIKTLLGKIPTRDELEKEEESESGDY